MKNDCHLFKSGYFEVLMFLKTDIDIDIPNICLMFGSEERRGEERTGEREGVLARIFQSNLQSLRPSVPP